VDIRWEITNEHVCHACIMLSYRVPGQAASRDEGEQTSMELAQVRIATTQQLQTFPLIRSTSRRSFLRGPVTSSRVHRAADVDSRVRRPNRHRVARVPHTLHHSASIPRDGSATRRPLRATRNGDSPDVVTSLMTAGMYRTSVLDGRRASPDPRGDVVVLLSPLLKS
jgi:hypothetical protein